MLGGGLVGQRVDDDRRVVGVDHRQHEVGEGGRAGQVGSGDAHDAVSKAGMRK